MTKIKVLQGNLFDSGAHTLVNTVNCVGVMGKGIALEFKKRFPDMYQEYEARCRRKEVRLGRPYLFRRSPPPWILNFPTKDHWRSLARIEDIIEGLDYLQAHYREWGIRSLAVPPLGTGQGQLEWAIVGPILFKFLSDFAIPVELYAPLEVREDELELSYLRTGIRPEQMALRPPSLSRIGASWLALVDIVRRLHDEPHHWPVGRTSFQKMAYIANEEGIPLELSFKRGSYGPYSPDLRSSLTRLQNNGLISERRSGSMFEVLIGPTFHAAVRTRANEVRQWDAIARKVADLFMRSNTRRAEVIATVIFVAKELREAESRKPTEREILDEALAWKQRRRPPFDQEELAQTIRSLAARKWLDIEPSADLEIADKDLEPV